MAKTSIIKNLYQELLAKYGRPGGQWKLWCKRPKTEKEKEEIIIGAVLTQRANWRNVEKAIDNLKKENKCSLKSIYELGRKNKQRLLSLVRPAGFYRQKAERLLSLAGFIIKNYGSPDKMQDGKTEVLRKEILSIKGLGPETVDDILLYALERPVFVIDEYTRRLIKKKKISEELSYDCLQRLFEKNLPKNYELYQDFHALIIIDGKNPPGQSLLFK